MRCQTVGHEHVRAPSLPSVGTGRKMMMVRKIFVSVALIGSLALASCNTVRGVGQDIQSVPDCIEGRTC